MDVPYQVFQRGPFHRVWEKTEVQINPRTGEITSGVRRYTGLANRLRTPN